MAGCAGGASPCLSRGPLALKVGTLCLWTHTRVWALSFCPHTRPRARLDTPSSQETEAQIGRKRRSRWSPAMSNVVQW